MDDSDEEDGCDSISTHDSEAVSGVCGRASRMLAAD